ncbi:MAG: IS6 family transposase [Rhodobacteraceae bacterium]|nr:IS6 family transposase [Paracoccaceae bacterium]
MAINFKGVHDPEGVILYTVVFHVRYGVSYCDPEEIMAEHGVTVDYATLDRWGIEYAPLIAVEAQKRKHPTAKS